MNSTESLLLKQAIEEIRLYSIENSQLKIENIKLKSELLSHTEPTSQKFNAQAYINKYPDVLRSGLSPIEHYNKFGKILGRSITT